MRKEHEAWLEQAGHDLSIAKISLENRFFEWACFQSHQSAEKALKALIIYIGEDVPRVHKISVLYHLCRSLDSNFREFYFDFDELDSLKFKAEYPYLDENDFVSPHALITEIQAQECLKEADLILDQVNEIMKVSDKEPKNSSKL